MATMLKPGRRVGGSASVTSVEASTANKALSVKLDRPSQYPSLPHRKR